MSGRGGELGTSGGGGRWETARNVGRNVVETEARRKDTARCVIVVGYRVVGL